MIRIEKKDLRVEIDRIEVNERLIETTRSFSGSFRFQNTLFELGETIEIEVVMDDKTRKGKAIVTAINAYGSYSFIGTGKLE